MAPRIAIVGAGSITFARKLAQDILAVPELSGARFAFTDIHAGHLEKVAALVRRDIAANKLSATVHPTRDRRAALEGADYVISCVRVGGLDAFRRDIEIPLNYGVDQCVGDTLCAGGVLYGQRNIPVVLDLCADIREVGGDDPLFLNYANPNAMNTWAANHYGEIPTLGLCHGVQGGHAQIASVIELLVNGTRKPGSKGFRPVTMKDVDIIAAGLNHQTWYLSVLYDGEDWTDRLLEGFLRHPLYSKTEKVRLDVMRRFGYYSTESNGHLSEYLAWYRKRPGETEKWISMEHWINGETGGYLRECIERRDEFETEYPRWLAEDPPRLGPDTRSQEHGSYIIEALETGRVYRGHFNVINGESIANLPEDVIVEVPCYVDRNGISVPSVGPLPTGCAAICSQSAWVQRLSVEAAVEGDVAKLNQALLMDPLTGAVCTPPEIERLVDEMLVAQAKWLPQYADAIPAAKRRLAATKPPAATRGFKGVPNVEALAADARARQARARPAKPRTKR